MDAGARDRALHTIQIGRSSPPGSAKAQGRSLVLDSSLARAMVKSGYTAMLCQLMERRTMPFRCLSVLLLELYFGPGLQAVLEKKYTQEIVNKSKICLATRFIST